MKSWSWSQYQYGRCLNNWLYEGSIFLEEVQYISHTSSIAPNDVVDPSGPYRRFEVWALDLGLCLLLPCYAGGVWSMGPYSETLYHG